MTRRHIGSRVPHPSGVRRAAWAVLLALSLLLPAAHATTFLEQTPEEMVLAADLIFVGTVASVRVALEAGTPWTDVTFTVEDWLATAPGATGAEAGAEPVPAEPATITLRFIGGVAASGERLTVSGLPRYQEGQRALVFAYDDAGLASPVVGVRQGTWTLSASGARNEDGLYLTVPGEGRLQLGPSGAGLEELTAAIEQLLASGVLPEGEPEDEPQGQPAGEPAGEPQDEPEGQPEGQPADEPADEPQDEPADGAGSAPGTEPEAEPAPPAPADDDADGAPEDAGEDGAADADEGAPEDPAGAAAAPAPAQPPAEAGAGAEPAPPLNVRYHVDERGGPLLLSTAVNRAAAAWEAAAPEAVDFVQLGDAGAPGAHEIAYGDADLFGPDALSLTLVRGGGATTEVLVAPTVGSLLEPVLLHELGVLMGLTEGSVGVMAYAVVPGAQAPTPADVAALRALRAFRPEDLNRDGVVDFYDLAAFGREYGRSGVNLAADLNGDGAVDDADLALLEAAYQFLPPSEQPPAAR